VEHIFPLLYFGAKLLHDLLLKSLQQPSEPVDDTTPLSNVDSAANAVMIVSNRDATSYLEGV